MKVHLPVRRPQARAESVPRISWGNDICELHHVPEGQQKPRAARTERCGTYPPSKLPKANFMRSRDSRNLGAGVAVSFSKA